MTATFPTSHAPLRQRPTSRTARAALARYLGTHDPLAAVDLTVPERTWVRVEHGEDADIWLITWPAGSSTGWHDHGSASGAFVVLEGQLTEYVWTGVATATHAAVARRARVRRQPHPRRDQPRRPHRGVAARLRPLARRDDALRAGARPAPGHQRRAAGETW